MFINSYPWGLVGRCRVGISGSGLVNQSGIVDVGLFFKSARRLICFIVFILFICWIWDGLSSCQGCIVAYAYIDMFQGLRIMLHLSSVVRQ